MEIDRGVVSHVVVGSVTLDVDEILFIVWSLLAYTIGERWWTKIA